MQPAVRDAAGRGRSAVESAPATLDRDGAVPAEAVPPRISRKRLVIGAVLVLLLSVGLWQGLAWWRVGRFIVSTDDAYVAADVSILASRAAGNVATLEVTNNQAVEAGQVIARIDDTEYRLAVQAAQDRLATQAAAVERIGRQVEAGEAQVAQAEPQIAAARADAIRTASDLDRQVRLSQSNYASKATFEQSRASDERAKAGVKSAEAGLLAARANVAVLQAQRGEAERLAAEYRTALAKTERDLSYTVIRAPVTGVVANRAVELGNYVQPGTRLMAIVPLASVHVDANVKETQLGRIVPGMAVRIEVDAFPDREIRGTVESVAPGSGAQFSLLPPENATGNFTKIVQRVPVRVKLDGEAVRLGLLRPGLSVVARVDTRSGADLRP